MDLNSLFIIFFVFIVFFIILKKNNLLIDNISYSNHKIIGAENKSPIIIGGVYILAVHLIFNYDYSIFLTLSAILITLLGFTSDKNILSNPKIRIIFQFLIIILLTYFENLKIDDVKIEFFNLFLLNEYFNLIFTVFCLAILINGSNFLDGLNGLLAGYYLIILITIIFLINSNNEIDIIDYNFVIIIIYTLFVFLFFNIFGKVYLGDSGTYLLSLLIGSYLITFNLNNDLLSPYYIAVLLWYPAFENLFSLIRRTIKKQKASLADNLHLHQLIFIFFQSKKILPKKILNSFCGILILLFNLPGFILANNFPSNSSNLLIIIFFNVLLYIISYYFLSKNLVFKK